MKRADSRERLRKGAKRLEASSFAMVGETFNGLSQKLPDNQKSEIFDPIPMPDVETYDLRTKKELKDTRGEAVKPIPLVIDGRNYKNQVRFGGYRFETPFEATKIVGLTHFGNGLYVQPAPQSPFLNQGRHALGVYEQQYGRLNTNDVDLEKRERNKAKANGIIMGAALASNGNNYRNACFEAMHEDYPNRTITVLALGTQHADGRHENAEAYEELGRGEKKKLSPNIHEFQGMQEVQGNNGQRINVRVIHANMPKFDDQKFDSRDLETLATIYADTLGQGNPLTIHCADGLDRSGGISFAMHLMKNYENVFVPGNEEQTLSNIMKEHAFMQDQRGGFFCTGHEGRLIGAFQLATIMKSIEMSQALLDAMKKSEPGLHDQLQGKNYVEQIEILAGQKILRPDAEKLLEVLVTRARTEQVYFSRFANKIDHPLIQQFNKLDQENQLSQKQDARVLMSDIQYMLRKGHNLDPVFRRPGQKSEQEKFRDDVGLIQKRIGEGENPADFVTQLTEMKTRLGAAGSGVFDRLTRKSTVSEPSKPAPAVTPVPAVTPASASAPAPVKKSDETSLGTSVPAAKWAVSARGPQATEQSAIKFSRAKKESPKADAASHVESRSGTLTGSMLRSSKRNSLEEPSEASQIAAKLGQVKALKVLSESGPAAFVITMNKVEGDFNTVVKDAKDAAGKTDQIVEFDGNCVIKTEDACIHLSKDASGETKLSVHSQADKQEKAFEDAAKIVHALGNKDCHVKVEDKTANKDVQGKIEQIHAQRESNLKY